MTEGDPLTQLKIEFVNVMMLFVLSMYGWNWTVFKNKSVKIVSFIYKIKKIRFKEFYNLRHW